MSEIQIRELQGEEMLEAMYRLNSYAFLASPPLMDKEEWMNLVRPRQGVTYFALFENGIPVAGVANTKMSQQVRGKLFDASGIWGVATDPAARRKGYCRCVMGTLLENLRQNGAVFSSLYPFRESFYERLGYATFPYAHIAKLTPTALLPLAKKDLDVKIDLLLIGDGFDRYRDYLQGMQAQTHGMALFTFGDRQNAQRNRSWVAFAMVDGQPAGLMLYQLKGEEISQFLFQAPRFYYTNSRAKYGLLQWVAQHTDQASKVEIWLPPYEQPETWLSDLDVKMEYQVHAPMGRVLDVAKLSGMQAGLGGFTARVSDPVCPWNEGIWKFASVDGTLLVEPHTAPDCDLSIQALTALVFGTHNPEDFAIRGWGNPSPAVQACMRALFPPKIPYLHEYF
jgi:predicted acetyltransferase